jgi:hypothetical protein
VSVGDNAFAPACAFFFALLSADAEADGIRLPGLACSAAVFRLPSAARFVSPCAGLGLWACCAQSLTCWANLLPW